MKSIKTNKLKRTISLRLTDNDFKIINEISNTHEEDMSKLLRKLISAALDMVKNNLKD